MLCLGLDVVHAGDYKIKNFNKKRAKTLKRSSSSLLALDSFTDQDKQSIIAVRIVQTKPALFRANSLSKDITNGIVS